MQSVAPKAYERSAIILAGGEGTRLRSLTRRIEGEEIPKQFCRLMGSKTLLEQTVDRVSHTIAPNRVMTVVTGSHRRFYTPLLAGTPRHLVVEQPCGRGTAPAILYALMRIAERTPSSVVALFPSDHHVSDDALFMRHIEVAANALDQRPELTVLLGIEPTHPEQSYGWIEKAGNLRIGEAPLFGVRSFVEKPEESTARTLMDQGALWNSFVMLGRVSTLINLFLVATPGLYVAFNSVRHTFDTGFEAESLSRLYADLPEVNFSSDVLQKCPLSLAVMQVSGVHWSDLGDPRRVEETWALTGSSPASVAA